ncbi:MAG: NAD-glutamate dehydrogenase [Pseudomonadales bacterium]|nr:NAD-glutamate dehydrogenase [Pseudomonadales bacterium]NRA13957.1 NAD-glutamate dehydrogenase [Oceanospirillaceae bacterium]
MSTEIGTIKASLLKELNEELDSKLAQKKATAVKQFAQAYYAAASESDLEAWRLDDLYGATLESWQFIQSYRGETPAIRVYNPSYEENGWQSTHTFIEVLQSDKPFLVDSLRMELNRRNLTIHAINNTVLTTTRDASGQLQKLITAKSKDSGGVRESLISVEIDRHTDKAQLADLRATLSEILNEVLAVVGDFPAMVKHCETAISSFNGKVSKNTKEDVKETKEFLIWLKDHFTFLGYDEYKVVKKGGKTELVAIENSQLGLLKSGDEYCQSQLFHEISDDVALDQTDIITFSKAMAKSRIHRPSHPDYISVKKFDTAGKWVGEIRFLGLYTSSVYNKSSTLIPIIRCKVESIMERSELPHGGHNWKELLQILEIHPRDEIFLTPTDELFAMVMGILQIHERRQIRLFIRKDRGEHFFSCLVYAPRDVYSTEFRVKVENILKETLGCDQSDFHTYFSESILARTQFTLRSSKGNVSSNTDLKAIETLVRQASRSWQDELKMALVEKFGEERGLNAYNKYGVNYPAGYTEMFNPRTGVADIGYMTDLTDDQPLALSFYRQLENEGNELNLTLYNLHQPLPLSDVLPVLEHLGLRVIDEHPYQIKAGDNVVWLHDFNLVYNGNGSIDVKDHRISFQEAYLAIWNKRASSDNFNRLVLGAKLEWRDVVLVRAYAAYMKQIRFPISTDAIIATLNQYPAIAEQLVSLFHAYFDPKKASAKKADKIEEALVSSFDGVTSLTDDRVLRQYLALIKGTVRTNFFQKDCSGSTKTYVSFKLTPQEIPGIPLPAPLFEIFVFSPRVQGVHLRGGKVARGGLRWSDRAEDFRTEVLGLVKAQQVKNAVIVPVGAKGGFVPQYLHDGLSREEFLAEGIACYKIFISALLDITDNLVEGEVAPPKDVVRRDQDDPYLVVAADKGTATFSDIANGISDEYGFWMGDAFASGGSVGYDHKGMGITAKGAWVSVERHFREMGVNTAKDKFTVIGIGDMAGDVFGNGMLLSDKICLIAAFNHMHIFIDPNPDAAKTFVERQRLFDLPRSSWSDYDKTLISKGGGLFDRSAKSIKLTAEIKAMLGVKTASMTPTDLINALLKAQVDLLWNGGIGTYIKASSESHEEVGDKANDVLRVNGKELRCKVIGEGGNLGTTQLGRVEYCLNGGRSNTDFIDNAAGVDCSDHEVNIKILLKGIMDDGDLTQKQRNNLLASMTDEVGELVLSNNYRQVQAISLAERQAVKSMAEYRRFTNNLEAQGKLNRELEFLPSDEVMAERAHSGVGLTRPELSVLISYAKADLKESLLLTTVPDDSYVSRELTTSFPVKLEQQYGAQMKQHRLNRELVATQVANHIVNFMGINFVDRLVASTGADVGVIAKAYILVRDIYKVTETWSKIEALDYGIDSNVQLDLMQDLQHLTRRATRWFVRNRVSGLDCQVEFDQFAGLIDTAAKGMDKFLIGEPLERWKQTFDKYVKLGVSEDIASAIASTRGLYSVLDIGEIGKAVNVSFEHVARAYFKVGNKLELVWFAQQLNALNVESHWQGLAREAFRDDLEWQHGILLKSVLMGFKKGDDIKSVVEQWVEKHQSLTVRWTSVLDELRNAEKQDYAMYIVAGKELVDLAKNTAAVS